MAITDLIGTPQRADRPARIAELRESIARRALTAAGVPMGARILNVHRISDIFVIATDEPGARWSRYTVEAYRIPAADDTDRDYEPSQAPKIWCPLAGWTGDDADEVPGMLAKAATYASKEAA